MPQERLAENGSLMDRLGHFITTQNGPQANARGYNPVCEGGDFDLRTGNGIAGGSLV